MLHSLVFAQKIYMSRGCSIKHWQCRGSRGYLYLFRSLSTRALVSDKNVISRTHSQSQHPSRSQPIHQGEPQRYSRSVFSFSFAWSQLYNALFLRLPPTPSQSPLFSFALLSKQAQLDQSWFVLTDKVFGGNSSAALTLKQVTTASTVDDINKVSFARFSGYLSKELPFSQSHDADTGAEQKKKDGNKKIVRSGLCSIRSKVRHLDEFNKELIHYER